MHWDLIRRSSTPSLSACESLPENLRGHVASRWSTVGANVSGRVADPAGMQGPSRTRPKSQEKKLPGKNSRRPAAVERNFRAAGNVSSPSCGCGTSPVPNRMKIISYFSLGLPKRSFSSSLYSVFFSFDEAVKTFKSRTVHFPFNEPDEYKIYNTFYRL